MLNVFQPSLGAEEAQAAAAVMQSNWIGRGPKVAEFEAAWAAHVGVPAERMVATTCATEGLFAAMRLLGIGPGDEVVLPAISFVGAANAVAATGARPVFCDVDGRSLNPMGRDVAACLSPRTRAVIVLHYGGVPCDDASILGAFCDRFRESSIPWPHLIEDCACAPASRIMNGLYGVGAAADTAVWSFDPMKIVSTGDGGMVYFHNQELATRCRQELYLGMDSASGKAKAGQADEWWNFDVTGYGRRAVMNDLTAAIGLEQLKKLPAFIARRQEIDATYRRELAGLDWLMLPPAVQEWATSSYYAFWVQLEQRNALARWLLDHDVYTTFRYMPLNRLPIYGVQAVTPNAEQAANRTLWLPMHQGLTDEDVQKVCQLVWEFGKTI